VGKRERDIGKRAERQVAAILNKLFPGLSMRRSQQYRGTATSSDLVDESHPELAPEIKRVGFSKRLHEVLQRARNEAWVESARLMESVVNVAFVVHRGRGDRWAVTVDLDDLPRLVKYLAAIEPEGEGGHDDEHAE
jgi:hypothetical protein